MSVQIQVTAETQQAARAVGAFTKNASDGMNQLLGRTGVARDSLQTFQRVANLVGFQAMPQLTGAVYLASDSWKTLSGSMKLAGLGVGVTSLALAGVSAALATGIFAWKAYAAEVGLAESKTRATTQQISLAETALKKLAELQGRLKEGEAERLAGAIKAAAPEYEIEKAKKRLVELEQIRTNLFQARRASGSPDSETQKEFDQQYPAEYFAKLKATAAKPELSPILSEAVGRIKATSQTADDLKNIEAIRDTITETAIARLDGANKERAEAQRRFDTEVKVLEARKLQNANAEELALIEQAMDGLRATRDVEFARIDEKERTAKLKIEQDITAEIRKREQAADAFYAREQEVIDRKAEIAAMENLQRIQSNPFLTDAEKYDQSKAAGADVSGVADPRSFAQQMSAGLVQLQNQFGTFSQASAAFVTNGIGTAIQGVSDGIMGLIDGTKTWAQAWGDVLRSMAAQGIQFIVNQTAMFLLNKAKELLFHTSTETAKTAASVAGSSARATAALGEASAEAVSTGAKAAGSVADIPYVGWALAIAAFAGVIAMVASASNNARALGGPVSAGQTYLVGERGPELFHAPANGGVLDNAGTMKVLSGGGSKSSGGGSGGDVNVKTIVVANIQAAMEEAMASARGTKIIVQTIGGSRLDLGLDT